MPDPKQDNNLKPSYLELNKTKIEDFIQRVYKDLNDKLNANMDSLFSELDILLEEVQEQTYDQQNFGTLINRNHLISELLAIIRDVNSNLTLDSILEKIIDASIHFLQAQRGAVLLLNDKQELEVKAARNNCKENMEDFPISNTVKDKVLSERKPLFLADLNLDDNLSAAPSIIELDVHSIMCAPLECSLEHIEDELSKKGEKQLLGLIYLDSTEVTYTSGFCENNLELLQALADQASVAINNALLNNRLDQTAQQLEKEAEEKHLAEQQLRVINENLEGMVEQRTTELVSLQKELLENAHKAGMADVAISVLHNIGNTLNNVFTSTQMIKSTLYNSKIKDLLKANDILEDHLDDFENYVADDPKGKKLLQYYIILGKELEKERDTLIEHISRITARTKVIEEVIVAQREYALTDRQLGSVNIIKMIDDALKIQESIFSNQRVQIKKELKTEAMIIGSQVKIIHVLLNLFKNAIEAMADVPPENRVLTITTIRISERIKVDIKDTGCGIEQEQIEKIFSQGFAGRRGRLGFGLHACANSMVEMQGEINAFSEGRGKGATFSLLFNEAPLTR